ncbi:thioredoxin family protein [Mucilaginibacter sp. RCC_168]|uniref:thioredoxin family protein n=1 Tax=Mucilaginibacter sp. RCC_168 TaxID=3239221 RepID=UPI003523355D
MKKFHFTLTLLALCGQVSFSHAQKQPTTGIRFSTENWASVLKTASRQHKLVFVDVYTSWCAPCKRMEKEVFPLVEVGKVYDSLFVSYRLDAEHGEGPKFAAAYGVKAYPTYLFLDSAGNLLYRSGDYLKAPAFIAEGLKAASAKQAGETLAGLEARFKSGDRQLATLKALLVKRTSLGMDNAEVLNAYVGAISPQSLRNPETVIYLSRHLGSTVSAALPLVIEGLKGLDREQQKQVSDRLYNETLYYALGNAIKDKRLSDAATLLADVDKIRPWLAEQRLPSADNLALHYYQAAKDTAGLKRTGYRMAAKQMAVPIDSIKKTDSVLFVKVMEPFLTGKQDSTKIPGFAVEKRLAAVQYSAGIASTLYTVANAFKLTLAPKDKALSDALEWMRFACRVYQNPAILKLRSELEAMQ